MSERIAYALPLLLMLMLGGLTFWLRQVIEGPEQPRTSRLLHEADSVVDSFTVTRLGTDGRPEARLSAKRMVHFADDDATELEQPLLERKQGGIILNVRADRGVVSRDYEDAKFYDNVQMIRFEEGTEEALRVNTDYLQVLIDEEALHTDRAVTISQGGSQISGVGMEYDRKSGRVALLSGVKATVAPQSRQGKP